MAKSWFEKAYDFFFGSDNEEDLMEEPEEPQRQPIHSPEPSRWDRGPGRELRPEPISRGRRGIQPVLSLHQQTEKPTVEVHYPQSYEDARRYGDLFKEGKMVAIDLGSCDKRVRQQIIDFLSGVAFGLEGTAQKVNHNVFLFAPRSFMVIGDIPPISDNDSDL